MSRIKDQNSPRVEAFAVDLNGVCRGKWLMGEVAQQALAGGLRLPISTVAFDIFGRDVPGSGLIQEAGDPDGEARPTSDRLHPMPWIGEDSQQIQLALYGEDHQPVACDPRHALARVAARASDLGFRVVIGTEIELYLLAGTSQHENPGMISSVSSAAQCLSTQSLHEIRPYLDDVASACEALSVPIQAMSSEAGPGQVEFELGPLEDPLRAADAVVALRRAARGYANRRGWRASFMAKPLGNHEGSGLHVHLSLIDSNGQNLFAGPEGEKRLLHAIGGCLTHLAESQLLFAPHANSYRRYVADGHAPISPIWGRDNRHAALRIPRSSEAARRFEHRLPGADANPYLILAAILGAALDGIENEIDPGKAAVGRALGDSPFMPLTRLWLEAIDQFESSQWVQDCFGEGLKHVLLACKRQEYETLFARVPNTEIETYLEVP